MKKEIKKFFNPAWLRILFFIFGVAILLVIVLILFSDKNCPYSTPCDVPSFLNPFGIHKACVQVLTPPMKCNLGIIYSLVWLIIITLSIFIFYLIKYLRKRKK